jgi:hypothetical protein
MAAPGLRSVTIIQAEQHERVVPVTIADAKYSVQLPAGWYYLRITGAQVNAGADGTIHVKKFVDAAQTTGDAVALYGEDIATIVGIATAIDMEAANTGMEFWFTGQATATNEGAQPSAIYLPYGLEITIDINAATALALTVHALRLGSQR